MISILFRQLSVAGLFLGILLGQADQGAIFRDLEKQWEDATLHKNAAALEQLMSPDFVLVGMGPNGLLETPRDAWLKNLSAMQFEEYRININRIRVYGDSAIVNIEGSWKVTTGAAKIDGAFALTDVWVKQHDRWQVVLRHSSRGSRP